MSYYIEIQEKYESLKYLHYSANGENLWMGYVISVVRVFSKKITALKYKELLEKQGYKATIKQFKRHATRSI